MHNWNYCSWKKKAMFTFAMDAAMSSSFLLLLEFPPICFGAPSISNRGILRFPYIFTGNWFKK
jgi:hypothetical protein